jgi:hypothetical protein
MWVLNFTSDNAMKNNINNICYKVIGVNNYYITLAGALRTI